jgi:methyl-accepting chemotaxis protein
MASAAQQVAVSGTEMAASTKSISRDTDSFVTSVTETAAAIEEMSRSISAVADNANDLAV